MSSLVIMLTIATDNAVTDEIRTDKSTKHSSKGGKYGVMERPLCCVRCVDDWPAEQSLM